jgi:hypothetical protein
MKKLFFALAILVLSACASPAEAKPHQLSWDWPVDNCDGTALDAADMIESELIYSTSPMPMPSDTDGPCAATPDPDAPSSATVVPIPLSDNIVTLNLQPGQQYYARIRVSAYINSNWSAWSGQVAFTVPYGRPNRIQLSAGNSPLDKYEFVTVSTSKLKFGG